jgi:hypothetical protein
MPARLMPESQQAQGAGSESAVSTDSLAPLYSEETGTPEPAGGPAAGKPLRKSAKESQSRGPLGELLVNADVPGARIYLNGATQPGWTTPYRFSLRAGNYRVSLLKPGFTPTNDWVDVRQQQLKQLTVRIRANRDSGGLIVRSEPPGLRIYIDGRAYGTTELYTELSTGSHVLRIVPPPGRQPYTNTIRIRPGILLKKTVSWPEGLASPANSSSDSGQPS